MATMEIQTLAIAKLYRREIIFNRAVSCVEASKYQLSEAPERIFEFFSTLVMNFKQRY